MKTWRRSCLYVATLVVRCYDLISAPKWGKHYILKIQERAFKNRPYQNEKMVRTLNLLILKGKKALFSNLTTVIQECSKKNPNVLSIGKVGKDSKGSLVTS